MQLTLLKAKLHRVFVTHAELEYEGSCAIDSDLLVLAGIREYEQLHIYNVDNGQRFVTYAIRAEAGTGIISVNGAAAHRADVGHKLITCTYASFNEAEVANFEPHLVYVDESNQVTRTSRQIPIQAA